MSGTPDGKTGGDTAYGFSMLLIFFQLSFLFLFAFTVKYQDGSDDSLTADWDRVNWYYPMYQDVHVMIFIGFGFLMTFLAKYAWSSVSYNMMVSCLCIQWAILATGFWECLFEGRWEKIRMATDSLIIGDFAAATILISFGGLLGRITPSQLLVMAFVEVIFYSLNEQICVGEYQAVDMGGSIYIHTFGAYFGLAVSAVLGAPKGDEKKAEKLNSSNYQSDLFAMIGTVFLFMFWPSFNGALCPDENFAKERVVLNTVLSLCCSCLMAFACSRLFDPSHKFNMVHVQNATLAGGVAIGSSSDLVVQPYPAMLIGIIAGTLSTFGYVYISPWLERKGLRDTCGIHNLHGMPGVLGGLSCVFVIWFTEASAYGQSISELVPARGNGRSGGDQAKYELAALGTTLFIAILSGILVGMLLKSPLFNQETNAFSDESHWAMDDEDEMESKSNETPMGSGGTSI